MRYSLMILLGMLVSLSGIAQFTSQDRKEQKRKRNNLVLKEEEEGVIVFQKHYVLGLRLINDGYGAFLEYGKASSVKKALLFQLDISERKSPKEEKQSSLIEASSPLISGKINFFYPVKLGVQKQVLLGNKANKNGINITGNYGGGIAIGVLRPYMVEVIKNSQRTYVSFNPTDSALFINGPLGGPTFTTGWSDISVVPGLYGKAAVRFDYGRFNEVVSALEVGITLEAYSKKIQILAYNPSKQIFLSGYVALVFGKRN